MSHSHPPVPASPPASNTRTPRILVVQHDVDGPMGRLAAPIANAGIAVDVWLTSKTPEKPAELNLLDYDGYISLGAVTGVNDRGPEHPWIDQEIDLVKEALDEELPFLGVCFGSQLLAKAVGAEVSAGSVREIGWVPVRMNEVAQQDRVLATLGEELWTFQWHFDAIENPPANTALVAGRSDICNQALVAGPHARATQFHIEASPSTALSWSATFTNHFRPGDPSAAQIWEETQRHHEQYREKCAALGQAFAAEVFERHQQR